MLNIDAIRQDIIDSYYANDKRLGDLEIAEMFAGHDNFQSCDWVDSAEDCAIITRTDGHRMMMGLDWTDTYFDDILDDWVDPEVEAWTYSTYSGEDAEDYITSDGRSGDINEIAPHIATTITNWLNDAQ